MAGRPILWVAVALRRTVAVTIFECEVDRQPASLRVGGVLYDRSIPCNLHAFYDWLRSEPGSIVGVRFLLREGCDDLQATLQGLPYVRPDTHGWLELYFSSTRQYKPEISGDQDFCLNGVLISEAGEYALYFGSGFPSEEDLESIRGLDTYVKGSTV